MKKNGFIRYNTYLFTEKDPIIDVLRTAKQQSKMKDSKISSDSNVSAATLRNWWHGKTKRPQFATVAAAANALGIQHLPITAEGRRELKKELKGN